MKTLLAAALLLTATPAFANYSLVCGAGREKGADHAEIALVQDPELLTMKFFLAGKELAKERFEARGGPTGVWYVTVFTVGGDNESRYEFREKPASVQEFKPGDKKEKIGAAKKCVLKK
jgi:hypothetical protein